MRFAVGSTRAPKLAAVRLALDRVASLGWPGAQVEVVGVQVPSGEADTPVGDEAMLAGARRRARSALDAVEGAGLGIGLEGGVAVVDGVPRAVVLRNWAVAWDGAREGVGAGPAVQLPEALAGAVLGGEDLAAAIDGFARQNDVRSRQGAFGVLTRDLVTRSDAFALAVIAALAPWYNAAAWMEEH
ncbi:MAG: inosine/xanthosine triphosphatase [Acidobacteriota bacterium]